MHDGDELSQTEHEQDDLKVVAPKDVFPEYYIIRVNEFDKLAVDPLEEWVRYLKDEYINPDTKAPGLKEAMERLEYLRMTPEQQRAYDHWIDTLVRDTDVIKTQMLEAEIKGRKEGISDEARNMKAIGLPLDTIMQVTGLSAEEIEALGNHGSKSHDYAKCPP